MLMKTMLNRAALLNKTAMSGMKQASVLAVMS